VAFFNQILKVSDRQTHHLENVCPWSLAFSIDAVSGIFYAQHYDKVTCEQRPGMKRTSEKNVTQKILEKLAYLDDRNKGQYSPSVVEL
jgi:hypothetical protein